MTSLLCWTSFFFFVCGFFFRCFSKKNQRRRFGGNRLEIRSMRPPKIIFLKKMNLCIEFFKKYGVPLSTPALVLFLAKVYLVLPSFLQGNLVLTYFYPI